MKRLYYLQYLKERTQYETGNRKFYECTKKNKKGETILIEQYESKGINNYVTDKEGNCYGRYNPTIYHLITDTYNGYQIDRDFLAKHSKNEILNETLRRFFKGTKKMIVVDNRTMKKNKKRRKK